MFERTVSRGLAILAAFATLSLARAQSSPSASRPASRPVQTLVAPPDEIPAAGRNNNNIPLSWKPVRYQQLFAPAALGIDGTILIRGIAFRLAPSFDHPAAGETELEIVLAGGPPTLAEHSRTFDDNLQDARQVVVPRTTVHVGPRTDADGKSWDVEIPFTRWYRFRTDRVLVLEIRVFGNDHGSQLFVCPMDAVTTAPIRRLYGEVEASEASGDDTTALVTRFDLAARTPAPATRPTPATRPAPATQPAPAPSHRR